MSILVDKISAHTLSHALLVPLLTKSDNNNKGVFKQVFANLVIALGGGFLSSFLLGQPFDVITDQWLVSAYVVAFFITFSLPPLEPGFLWNTLIAVDAVHRGLVLVAAIETVIALLGADAYFTQFIIGFVSSNGGGLIYNIIFNNDYNLNSSSTGVTIAVLATILANKFSYLFDVIDGYVPNEFFGVSLAQFFAIEILLIFFLWPSSSFFDFGEAPTTKGRAQKKEKPSPVRRSTRSTPKKDE